MLRCLICRLKKNTWKKLKTHYMARHSNLVCQVMKLFSRDKLSNLIKTLTKSLSNKLNNSRNPKSKKKVQKTRYSRIFSTTNTSTSSSPSKNPVQNKVDGTLSSIKDEDQLEEEKTTKCKRKCSTPLVNDEKRVSKQRPKQTKNSDETHKTDVRSCEVAYDNSTTVAPNSATVQSRKEPVETYSRENYNGIIKISESDTESCSDNGKNIVLQNLDSRYYCKVCGNGYNTEQKLLNHFQMHTMGPKLDRFEFVNPCQDYRAAPPPPLKVFACYVCTSEFLHKKALLDHLNAHYEYEIMEGILDMEHDYNLPKALPHPHAVNLNYMNLDHKLSIKYIMQYLVSNTSDQYYYNNNFTSQTPNNFNNTLHPFNGQNISNYYMRTICDYCEQELHSWEYQFHLLHFHNVVANF